MSLATLSPLWPAWPGLLSPVEALVASLPGQPPPLLHAQPPGRCLFQITKVAGSHMRKGPLPVYEARLQHSTGAPDGEAGSLRHLVGETHPARRVRLGPALLGPSIVLLSHSVSASLYLPCKPPPPSFPHRLLPSPQAPAAPASLPTLRCQSFQGLHTCASLLELSAWNPLPGPPELAADLVHRLHSSWFTSQASRGICSSIPFLYPG